MRNTLWKLSLDAKVRTSCHLTTWTGRTEGGGSLRQAPCGPSRQPSQTDFSTLLSICVQMLSRFRNCVNLREVRRSLTAFLISFWNKQIGSNDDVFCDRKVFRAVAHVPNRRVPLCRVGHRCRPAVSSRMRADAHRSKTSRRLSTRF